ncbi:MAG TPA: PepSY-associated TM helix domain-containing protein [Nannocystis sp.]
MPEPAPAPAGGSARPGRFHRRVRPWLRALHRDIGYFAVGLTVVYALSGLAVNHIADWDPNFHNYEARHQVGIPLPEDEKAAAARVLAALQITEPPTEVYRSDARELSILLPQRTLHVDLDSGRVLEDGQRPRLLLRVANWLHLNRGKKAWTYIADGYAVFLLFLAGSGLFMLPGRKGLLGRGGVLVALGVAVPVLYVHLSGGP